MTVSMGRGTLLGVGFIRVEADTAPAEKSLGSLGKAAVVGAAGLATLAVATTAMAASFNSDMLKIQTQAGGTAADVKSLSASVLGMKDVQQGPNQLAEALYHLKSIGLDNASAMKDLRVASDLASVGGSNLEATTNALGGAWRSGIKGAETFAQSAATVNAVIGAGNMRMEDFVAAIGTGILPAAKTFGVSLSSIGSALALMTDEGIPAVDAATRLKMSLSLLAAPSHQASDQLKSIGLTGLQLADTMRSPAGLVGTIGLLKQHLDASGLSLSQQAILLSHAFGGGRSSSAILTMINNYDVLVKKQDQVNASLGKFPAAVAAQRATVSAQFKILTSSLESSGIQIGEVLIPPVTKFVTFLNSTAIPAVTGFAHSLAHLVPAADIRADLVSVQSGFSSFIDGITGKASSSKVTAMIVKPWTDALHAISAGPGAALSKQLLAAQGHIGLTAVSAGPGAALSRQLLGAQTPSSLYARPSPGPGSAAAAQLMLRQVPGARYTPATAAKPPDVGPWQKAGATIAGIVHNLTVFAGQVAVSFGRIVVAATPAAVFLGTVFLGALSQVAHILSTVVGPALLAFTGFLEHHQGAVKFFAEVILGGLIAKMTILGGLKVATGVVNLGTAILGFPTGQLGAIGTGFSNLKTAASKFGDAASGIGGAVKTFGGKLGDLGRGLGSVSSSAWSKSATAISGWGTTAKHAAQDAAQLAADGGKALAQLASSAWGGITKGASAVGTAISTASKATWDWVTAAAASTAAALKQAAVWTAQKVAVLASAAAEGIATAAQWLWNLAMDASPIGLVIIGITALVGAIIWVATKTTWFQTAWKYTWGAIKDAALATWHFLDTWVIQPIAEAFSWLWTHAIQPALRFIVVGFLDMAGSVLHAASDMLGWMPGVGGLVKSALKEFNKFRDGVNAALGGIQPKVIPVTVSFNGVPQGKITGHTYTSTTGFSYAGGGPVRGPGSGTSDSIWARVANGEHIWTAAEVRKAGGHKAVARMRADARASDNSPRYASGGMVGFIGAASADMSLANRTDIASTVKSITSAYAAAYNAAAAKLAATVGGVIPTGQHLAIIDAAMAAAGVPPPGSQGQWEAGMNTLIGRESGWNPSAINLTDINAQQGHPSQGLAQTIPGTFDAFVPAALRGLGILNPVANVAAAIRYIVSRYGNISAVQQANASLPPLGYDQGGWLPPGLSTVYNGTRKPERVLGPQESIGGDVHIHLHNDGVIGSQRELENWLSASLTNLSRNGRLRGLKTGTS